MPTGVYPRVSGAALRERLAEIDGLQSLAFTEKLGLSRKLIGEALKEGGAAVMFSGGKDSTVLAHLVAEQTRPILLYNNTGMSQVAAVERVRRLASGLAGDYLETTPPVDTFKLWEEKGHYPIFPKRGHTGWKQRTPGLQTSPVQCCYWHKEKPAREALRDRGVGVTFWGNRAAESRRRRFGFADNGFFVRRAGRPWALAYPLQHWIDRDVSGYLAEHFPGESFGGWESGCKFCAVDITFQDNNLTRLLRNEPQEFKRLMLAGMGAEVAKAKGFPDADVGGILEQAPEWFARVEGKTSNG